MTEYKAQDTDIVFALDIGCTGDHEDFEFNTLGKWEPVGDWQRGLAEDDRAERWETGSRFWVLKWKSIKTVP